MKKLWFLIFLIFIACTSNNDDYIERKESIVYMTKDISPNGLVKVYESLNRPAFGNVGIKLHMGEPGNNNFLSPGLIKDLTVKVNGTFIDSNTAYGGKRGSTKMHKQVAFDHGFTAIAPVDILDEEGEVKLPIIGGKHLNEAIFGSHYDKYNFILSIAHFKGHAMAGFGGTFKNLAIGMASVKGKTIVHRGKETGSIYFGYGDKFLERIAEYTKAIIDDKKENIVYINVLNNLSVDCDCISKPKESSIDDIGILASLDPVALDKASVDMIYNAPDEEKKHIISRIKSKNGTHLLDYAEKLGLGSQEYKIFMLDD